MEAANDTRPWRLRGPDEAGVVWLEAELSKERLSIPLGSRDDVQEALVKWIVEHPTPGRAQRP